MRLASIRHHNRERVVADLGADKLVDVNALLEPAGESRVDSMLELIERGPPLLGALRQGLAAIESGSSTAATIDAADVSWHPPVRRPGKICAVAMNNSASNARKISAPDHPAFFLKPPSCLIGHLDAIRVRPYYGSVHPEPELAAVIGRTTRDAPASTSLESVFGYTIFDDVTSNGMRAEDMFHYWAVYAKKDNPDETERVEQHVSYAARYKGSDTFGVMGPWLVTRDDVPHPDDLDVYCSIHGETIAEDSTRYYNYKVAEVVSFISYFHTLHPGDVISFGTAFKASGKRKSIHHANFQTVEGPVEIRIDRLGSQCNPIVIERTEIGPWRLS